jgi:hypothetical protein
MRSININDRTIYFIVKHHCSEWCDYFETHFFEEYETLSKKKWVLFGPTVTYQQPNIMFSIRRSIDDPKLTKEYWRREISKKLAKYDSLKTREKEINSNQYI